MAIIEYYNDLLGEIELLQWLHDDLVRQLKYNNSREVWGHSMPLDKALNKYDNIIDRMKNIEEEIDRKNQLASKIETGIKGLKGIEYAVAFMRDIEGKNLTEIAEETKFSYSYITKINSKIKKEKAYS